MRKSVFFLIVTISLFLYSCSYFLSSYDGPEFVSHGYVEGVSPASSGYSPREYPTVRANWEGPGGDKVWLAVNLGATAPPESSMDDSPARSGWYFQFNRKQAYHHNGQTRIPQWRNRSINENQPWQRENDPCFLLLGSEWRLPLIEELRAFRSAPMAQGGMGEGNRTAAFNSTLRLHAAGVLHSFSGDLRDRGTNGSYWTSDQFSNTNGEVFGFGDSSGTFGGNKAFGRSVRCIKDD